MQNPQLLQELLTLLKQSEGFLSLPTSQQEMIIRTYESATDQQIERALAEIKKTENTVDHINDKEAHLIKKELKIEEKVEKLEMEKEKLAHHEMAVVAKTANEVSKHQMTIDDLTGEKTEVALPQKTINPPKKVIEKKAAKPVSIAKKVTKKNVTAVSKKSSLLDGKKKSLQSIQKKNNIVAPARKVKTLAVQKTEKQKVKVKITQEKALSKSGKESANKKVQSVVKKSPLKKVKNLEKKSVVKKLVVTTPKQKGKTPVVTKKSKEQKPIEKKKSFFGFLKGKLFGKK